MRFEKLLALTEIQITQPSNATRGERLKHNVRASRQWRKPEVAFHCGKSIISNKIATLRRGADPFQHLTSYPLVSDGITTYKSNPYGQKSLSLFADAYSRLASPLMPYLRGPYAYVAPYVAKADELGDNGLTTVETRFPIVKEDTSTIKGTVLDVAFYPVKVVNDGKEYIFKTYEDENNKTEGKGLPKLVKSVVSTELKIAADMLHFVAEWLGPRKEKAQKVVDEKMGAIKNELSQ